MKNRKSKRGKNGKNNGLQYSTAEVMLPAIILLVSLIVVLITIVNGVIPFISNIGDAEAEQAAIEEELWRQAYLDAEKNKVGVIFETISTTEEQYKLLREACNNYIDSEFSTENADANINVDTVVDETLYIDNGDGVKDRSSSTVDSLSETGPIYFQNMLMLRYINSDGTLKVVTSMIDESDNISIASQSELPSLSITTNTEDEIAADADSKQEFTTEKEYLDGVCETIHLMLLANSTEKIREADSKSINYFTYEGKQTVFNNKKDIALSDDAVIETIYVAAGKSDTSKTYKDRIYTQQRVTIGENSTILNIVLKLNSNIRIFDIDII